MTCIWCSEPIEEPCPSHPDLHHECGFRMVAGSAGHLQRACSCYGRVDTSEDNLTRREAARRALEYYREAKARAAYSQPFRGTHN
jgi:hypothetical protein